ncbi:unnamed protein product [Lactuca virosa]|uniref:Uncharacterized protein n=1 Tax=Lactuca virosa TaxID=75947 RepID=A0AAU9PK89_9ASTR|nr:unnamed protein product [Lactuca virosa]
MVLVLDGAAVFIGWKVRLSNITLQKRYAFFIILSIPRLSSSSRVFVSSVFYVGYSTLRVSVLFFTEIFKKTIQKHGLSGGVISLREEYSFKESRMAARSRNTCCTYAIRKLKRLSITILSYAFCYIGIGLSGTMAG